MTQCTYCDKPVRKSYRFNPFLSPGLESIQCDRIWCKLIHGYYLKKSFLWKYVQPIVRFRIKITTYQNPITVRVRRI